MFEWNETWLAQRTEAPLEPELPIVDAHHHLWEHAGMGRFSLEDLHAETSRGHRVEATVFVECLWGYRTTGPEHLRPVGETETIAAIAADSRGKGAEIRGIVSYADLTRGDAVEDVLDAHVEAGRGWFRGIRYPTAFHPDRSVGPRPHTRPPKGLMGDSEFRRGIQQLASRDLTFDAWVYHTQIPELTTLARAVPECVFVVDHLGGPLGVGPFEGRRAETLDLWRADIAVLATCPNVTMKLGGLGMTLFGLGFEQQPAPPSSEELVDAWGGPIEYLIERFGVDRCMFESNFPVDKVSCSYVTLWNAFKRVARVASPSEKAALFYGTASRIYRLAGRAE